MNDGVDELLFSDEVLEQGDEINPPDSRNNDWKVLIVDDEQGVHDVTLLALKRFDFEDRGIQFLQAYSAEEGKKLFHENDNIAVALIDIVMETDEAGLELVKYIRETLNNSLVRLILRTGQPGVAPEATVIRSHDINDYKDKTELTKQKLSTVMYSALRSYRDLIRLEKNLIALEENRKGLEQVVKSTSTIHRINDLDNFVSGLLKQLMSVAGNEGDSICAQSSALLLGCCESDDTVVDIVVSGSGIYSGFENQKLDDVVESRISEKVRQSITSRNHVHFDDGSVFYIENEMGGHGVILLTSPCLNNNDYRGLIELFCSNISIAYQNISLNNEIDKTQREIIFTLGSLAEFRSKETGDHIRRVADYVKLIATELNLEPAKIEMYTLASPLHDVGKLAIPDAVLHKPGRLNDEEFEIMKNHSSHGYETLKNSNQELLKCAAEIAVSHHEKWDGSGYPNGLSGKNIPLSGRIVAVADVFDALGTRRSYKEPWHIEKIIEYFKEESGKHFDPDIVAVLEENLEEFIAIHDKYN